MDEAVNREFPPNSNNPRRTEEDAARPPMLGTRPASAMSHPFILKISFSNYLALVVLVLSTTYLGNISGQAVTQNFSVPGTSYDCRSNIICRGQAHRYDGDEGSSGILPGALTLLNTTNASGIAYYKDPVQFLEPSSQQAASFSTSFTIYVRDGYDAETGTESQTGDGMTFVISANNSYVGGLGGSLGIFGPNMSTPFKSIVVELDTWMNHNFPIDDINGNHVSFDFGNITAVAAADASDVNVDLSDQNTKYVWVDYSEQTQQLEVRLNFNSTKPMSPLLNYTVNLYDHVEELMWVGFSSGSGWSYSNFYVGDWTFESFGIRPSPPPPPIPLDPPLSAPDPAPAPVPGQKGAKSKASKLGTAVTLKKTVGIAVGSTLGFLAFILVCVVFASLVRRRSGGNGEQKEDFMVPIEGMPETFTYKQLSLATRSFTDETKLGQGGFGSVHHGVLPESGVKVAIKKINSDSKQGEKEFMAEVSIISQLRHRNLIQLQGWCKNKAKKQYILVYELMSNGSLDKVLFGSPGPSGKVCLSWAQRFNIVTGVAAALDYLHQGWKQQVLHRDIKSSNIMLDDDWNAKLGDFGLARLVDHQKVSTTTVVAGTYGYIAPEAAVSGKFTDKTDVFAFGAVVLEIACGRKALSADLPPGEVNLVDWVWDRLSKGVLLSTVDKRLEDYDKNWMEKVLRVGLLCSHPNPLARPSMRHVVQLLAGGLAGDIPVPSIPASKPVPFGYDDYWQRIWSDFSLSSESRRVQLSTSR